MSPKGNRQHGAHRSGADTNKKTADRLREAHEADPDEINIAISELDAQKAFRDQQGRS